MIYNKTLSLTDYNELEPIIERLENLIHTRVPGNMQHYHRRWEYCMAISALQQSEIKTILEVGSGGSLFAPLALAYGFDVTVVDPDDTVMLASKQGVGKWYKKDFMEFDTGMYDAVVCLSVIEHVLEDKIFFHKLASHALKNLFLTTDYSPMGAAFSSAHLRTYNYSGLINLVNLLDNWEMTSYFEIDKVNPIYNKYSFASLHLEKTNDS